MSKFADISRVKLDSDGEPYIEVNTLLSRQPGWNDQTLLDWKIVGDMVIIRKTLDDCCST